MARWRSSWRRSDFKEEGRAREARATDTHSSFALKAKTSLVSVLLRCPGTANIKPKIKILLDKPVYTSTNNTPARQQ